MSLPQKLTAFTLLLVTGTSWLLLGLCERQAGKRARAEFIANCEGSAGQLVDTLGETLLHDPDATATPVDLTRQAMLRLVKRQHGHASAAAVANLDGRVVIVQDLRRNGAGRPFGTPVELPNAGHRANRTGKAQHAITDLGNREVCTAFAPIRSNDRKVVGLLIFKSELPTGQVLGNTLWTGASLALLLGLLGASVLIVRIGRPMQRMQEQLIAKESLSPTEVRSPSDLLREVTKSIDRASTDRSFFEARLKQQAQGQESRIRMKDEMVANTVHELRTPLTSIIASLEIILSHHQDMSADEWMEFINQANIAGKHMMFLVNDLLDTAAVEAGKINMETERCNLRKLLSDAKRSMDMVAAAKSMELTVPEINPEIHVFADYARCMQIIFNLVSNSVKYAPEGGQVTLRAWANMKSVTIEIEDQGDGIPMAMRAKLFTKFSRIRKHSDEPSINSSGIGLYLSKKLVELMQGTIGYREGDSGGGSVFWFTLPMAPMEQPAAIGAGRQNDVV